MTRILVAALLCVHFVGEGRTLYVNKKEDMSQSVIREHSFSAPFFQDWWQGGVPNFKTIGGAVVTDEAVLLTQDRPNQSGTIINSVPMVMDHWELKINFRIHGKQNPGADGMALWYTERPATLGPIYGQYPSFKGFGIILDSFDNNNDREQPGISMIQNLEGNRGKTTWSERSDYKGEASFQCASEYRNTPDNQPATLRVLYRYKKLEVFIQLGPGQREVFCGMVAQLQLPPKYFFSLGAKTGTYSDNHEIYSFTVTAAPGVVEDAKSSDLKKVVFNPDLEKQKQRRASEPEPKGA